MVLNGSLHEYILADILQLLSQQKTSGKLQLMADHRSGFIVLHQGMVIAAEETRESIQSKLVNFLLTVRRVPERTVANLMISAKCTLDDATAELVARQLLSQADIAAIARACIEDFTCSLFTWNSGEYRFESLENTASFAVSGISLSADYIIMEAMRRIDETKRVRTHVLDDTIFVTARRDPPAERIATDAATLLGAPNEYAILFVDGLSTVEMMAGRMFVSRFRCYEIFHTMWEQQLITPLSTKYSRSIQAALNRSRGKWSMRWIHAVSSVCVTILLVSGVLGAGFMARKIAGPATPGGTQTASQPTPQKVQTATLEYWIETGSPPQTTRQLVAGRYVSPEDIRQSGRKIR